MNTLDVLIAARAKIEQGWTQGKMARDNDGVSVRPLSDDATCWCAAGAITAAGSSAQPMLAARAALTKAVACRDFIGVWNDKRGRTQAEVLAAFDRAIEAEGKDLS